MSTIPGHPFDLGADWDRALAGDSVDFTRVLDGYVGAVDWPASMFWPQIAAGFPDAVVLLSVRADSRTWWASMDATVLPTARMALEPGWTSGYGLNRLLERFTGTQRWDDPELLMRSYDRHVERVREAVPPDRLVEWRAEDGWEPICAALGVPVPEQPFPWRNRREDWG